MTQESLMLYDPATGSPEPYPSHANQWRIYHGSVAWLYNPWTGVPRDARDVGTDCFGYAIVSNSRMSYGKSQAAITYALARLEFDTGFKIGVTCKSTYKRLLAQGIPETNLVKMWERVEPELMLWYDEIYNGGIE